MTMHPSTGPSTDPSPTSEIDLDLLLDAVVAGIRSGHRIEHDRDRMAKVTGVNPEQLHEQFPDDDALYIALIDFLLGQFGARLAGQDDMLERTLAERYLDISIPKDAPERRVPERKAEALMLLTLVNPACHRVAQSTFALWQGWLNESAASPAAGHLLRFIADGWWFTAAFGLGPVAPQDWQQVHELMHSTVAPLYVRISHPAP